MLHYFIPHPWSPGQFDGHRTRFEAVQEVIPDSVLGWQLHALQALRDGVAVIDTYPLGEDGELARPLYEAKLHGTKLVYVARTNDASFPIPFSLYDRIVVPAYEEVRLPSMGAVPDAYRIGPLVREALPGPLERTFLCIVSPRIERIGWWLDIFARLEAHGASYRVLSPYPISSIPMERQVAGRGTDWIDTVEAVICGASMTMYEALWAGKRVLAHAWSGSERRRLQAARLAGEAVASIDSTREISIAIRSIFDGPQPLGRRTTGQQAFAEIIEGLS